MRSTTIVTRLTVHDDVMKSLLRGAPRLGLALGPASARAVPGYKRFVHGACKACCYIALLLLHSYLYFTNLHQPL